MSENDKTAAFFSSYPQHSFSSGHVIISPGEKPKGVYYIVEGLVRQYDIADNGDQVTVNVMKPGSHFLMTWAVNDAENVWYFEAANDVVLRIAPSEDVIKFLKDNPEEMYGFLKRLCSGSAGQQRRMAHLMGGSARTRVIYELIIELRRFGEKTDSGYKIVLSENQLASKAGLSREAVNRELSKLKSEDLIERKYREIHVNKIEALENELGYKL